MKSALRLETLATCSVTKARANQLHLPHATVKTPVFMPVGTQGVMKGITVEQLEAMDCNMILGNTYHLVRDLIRGASLLIELGPQTCT